MVDSYGAQLVEMISVQLEEQHVKFRAGNTLYNLFRLGDVSWVIRK